MSNNAMALIDKLVEVATGTEVPEIQKFVGHMWPDVDVWFCVWLARRFMPKAKNAELVFVRAGERLSGSEDDPSILHFDTGGGEFDQHGLGLAGSSSASLLAEALGITRDPGIQSLLSMVNAVDNAAYVEPTSLHFLIEGLPRHPAYKRDNSPDWSLIKARVFEFFDIIYGQDVARRKGQEVFDREGIKEILGNGLRLAGLPNIPQGRDTAFAQGAAVVVWSRKRGKKDEDRWWGIQANSRRFPGLDLTDLAAALREEEARVKNLSVNGHDLRAVGECRLTPWFLHDSLKLILAGSPKHPLSSEECSRLEAKVVFELTKKVLGAIPKRLVEEWKHAR